MGAPRWPPTPPTFGAPRGTRGAPRFRVFVFARFRARAKPDIAQTRDVREHWRAEVGRKVGQGGGGGGGGGKRGVQGGLHRGELREHQKSRGLAIEAVNDEQSGGRASGSRRRGEPAMSRVDVVEEQPIDRSLAL